MAGTIFLGGGEHVLNFELDSETTAHLLLDDLGYKPWASNVHVKKMLIGVDSGVIKVKNHLHQTLLLVVDDAKEDWLEALVSQVRATVSVDVGSVSLGAENTYQQHSHKSRFQVSRVGKSNVKKLND